MEKCLSEIQRFSSEINSSQLKLEACPASGDLWAGHSPRECHPPPASRWHCLICLPREEAALPAGFLMESVWKRHTQGYASPPSSLIRYLWSVPKQETVFSCSFLSLKTSFTTRKLHFFLFFPSPFKILHGLPAFLLSPIHYCSKLACDYFNHQSSLPLCCSTLLIKMTLLCSFSITVIKAC